MPAPASAGTPVAGLITIDTVWDIAGSPYWVVEDLTVAAGVSLTVQPGVVVKFNPSRSLYVEGDLEVNGTVSQRVLFTSNSTELPSAWRGIQVNASGEIRMSYARLEYGADALYLAGGSGRFVANTTFRNNHFGITASSVSNSVVSDCRFENHTGFIGGQAITLGDSFDNSIVGNVFNFSTWAAVALSDSRNNSIYHNSFLDNPIQAQDDRNDNLWNDSYPSGGNYWSDYAGTDLFSGPSQDQPGADGIGDTPYEIDPNSSDSYPLMEPMFPDDVPPVVSIDTPSDGEWFDTTNVRIAGSAYDLDSGLTRVEVSCDEGSDWNTAVGTTSWTYDCSGLSEGSNIITARAFDAFGLESNHATVLINIDLAVPVIAMIYPQDGEWLNASSVGVGGTAVDPGGSGLNRVEVSCDGGATWGIAIGTTFWTFDCAGLSEGANIFLAKAYDLVGGESVSRAATVNVDITSPTVTINSPISGLTVGTALIDIIGNASDNLAISAIKVENEDIGWWGSNTSVIWMATVDLTAGWNVFHIQAIDRAGNPSSTASVSIFYDNEKPSIAIFCDKTVVNVGDTIECSVAVTDNRGMPFLTWAVMKDGVNVSAGGSSPFDFTPNEKGEYIIQALAVDQVGNSNLIELTIRAEVTPFDLTYWTLSIGLMAIMVPIVVVLVLRRLKKSATHDSKKPFDSERPVKPH